MKAFSFYSLLFVAILALFGRLSHAGVPGGWQTVDPNDEQVIEATKYAVHSQYPNGEVTFKVTQAQSQVVAGMKYDITVAVTSSDFSCSMHEYKVVHTLDNRYILLNSEDLSSSCPDTTTVKKLRN